MPKKLRYEEQVCVGLLSGWRERIDRAAEYDDQSSTDWLRAAIRRALLASERRQRENGGQE